MTILESGLLFWSTLYIRCQISGSFRVSQTWHCT